MHQERRHAYLSKLRFHFPSRAFLREAEILPLLALRTTLGAALCVSLELKAANVRLRRQPSDVIHSEALLAA